MNKDQGGGIIERVVYGIITFLVIRYGTKLGLTTDDSAWLGGGLIALVGSARAWWHNRPVGVLNRAGNALPDNAKLIITTTPLATPTEKAEAKALAAAASDKVVSETS